MSVKLGSAVNLGAASLSIRRFVPVYSAAFQAEYSSKADTRPFRVGHTTISASIIARQRSQRFLIEQLHLVRHGALGDGLFRRTLFRDIRLCRFVIFLYITFASIYEGK
mmetsp:Transcript_11222/g.16536  ORF Transcript_11222/g.16536 Transcript_11222/m.16536 type:complete len:109 (+) Transcript_11222:579-905(+)